MCENIQFRKNAFTNLYDSTHNTNQWLHIYGIFFQMKTQWKIKQIEKCETCFSHLLMKICFVAARNSHVNGTFKLILKWKLIEMTHAACRLPLAACRLL